MKRVNNSKHLTLLFIVLILFIGVVVVMKLNNASVSEEKGRIENMNYIEKHGRLAVKGTQLVDENGSNVVLKGLSSHGMTWYPEFINYRSLETIKGYGANAFRIAMYVAQNDGYLEKPELSEKLLYSAIEDSLAAGLYTIVDWHVLKDENPNYNVDKALEMFEKIAKRYGEEKGIIYEICNEPNGDTTYKDIVEYANKVIPVIKKYAPEAVILVGTPKFCTSLTGAISNPIQGKNIMYTYHFYAGLSDCKNAIKEITKALDNDLAIFVSEWGIDGDEASKQDFENTKKFLDFLNERQISWINWSLSNKDEGYSFVDHKSDKLHDWTDQELSNSGQFVLEYLKRK